jgi:superoxide dismutase
MHWRDSWNYGSIELVTDEEDRAKHRVLGTVTMCKGRITGRIDCVLGRDVASEYYYDGYGNAQPDVYKKVMNKVEESVIHEKSMPKL